MKKVTRILSIDWDYFINATATQRALLFPDGGNENISYTLQDFIWDSRYSGSPELKDIDILRDDYFTAHHIIFNFYSEAYPRRVMMVTVSHRWIYDFIKQFTKKNEQFEVYNIDFHHDMYNFRNEEGEVHCGNWVNCLFKERPNMKYFWIKREDSDTELPIGRRPPCETKKLKDIEDLSFDAIFICRSDCWSPPHLDNHFDRLWIEAKQSMPVITEDRVTTCRKVSILSEVEEKYKEQLAISMMRK